MISDRIILIFEYLHKHKTTTYKTIASELELKERYVRYDVERMNDILLNKQLPVIEKMPKGVLVFPEGIEANDLFVANEFAFSQEQRISFIKLIILFDMENLNIRKLSEDFEVSRTSIKKDLSIVVQELNQKGIKLIYENGYYIQGNEHKLYELMVSEFQKYIYMYGRKRVKFNAYETYAKQIFEQAFAGNNLKSIITWIKEFLEGLNCVLTDDSFRWYVANIVVAIWYSRNEKKTFENILDGDADITGYEHYIAELERISNVELLDNKRMLIIRFLMYTSRYDRNKHNLPLLHTEQIVQTLISDMSQELDVNFENDELLYDGLVNHIAPLLGRVLDGVEMSEDIVSLLNEDTYGVFEAIAKVIKNIEILKEIQNDNEIGYLTIHFVASIKRLLNTKNKNILLVCGLGYGTTTLVKETLVSEFQVEIIDTIPSYKLQSYQNWKNIDYVITTMDIQIECPKKVVQIQPIFTNDDYKKIESLGLLRKSILSSYYSINAQLDFLKKEDKQKVMEIIRKELGYPSMSVKVEIRKLSDLLEIDTIMICDEQLWWEEAVLQCAGLLEKHSDIDKRYTSNILESMKNLGFYSVIDERFALLHGSSNAGVHRTKMSLLICKEPIEFGDKKTNVIFCLASIDQKEHIPAVTNLMNIVKETNFLSNVVEKKTNEEIYYLVKDCEVQVEELFKSYK